MLEKLLNILSNEGVSSPVELARRLDTSPVLVEQMITHLASAGKLQQVYSRPLTCALQSCPVQNNCSRCAVANQSQG